MTSGRAIRTARLLLSSVLLSLPLASTALAAAPFEWSGFYIGINGGYGIGVTDLSTPDGASTTTRACDAGVFGILPLYEVPAGTVFSSPETGNQRYPAGIAATLDLVNNGAGLYIPQQQGAWDFTATGAPVAPDECIFHTAYALGPGGNYFGGRPGVQFPPLGAPFPVGFVPQDSAGTIVTTVTPGTGPSSGLLQLGGWVGGMQAGYNHILKDRFLLGVETDLALANISGNGTLGANTASATVNWIGSVRTRIGVVKDAVLFYLTAGGAVSGITVSTTDGATTASASNVLFGWTGGGGIEYAVTDALSLRAEYLYFGFRSGTSTVNGSTISGAPSFSTVTVGLNYHR